MEDLPFGTVTFLFTDIEASTALAARLGDRRYANVLDDHHQILRGIFTDRGGEEIRTEGDSFLVIFRRVSDAVVAAVAGQRAIAVHPWPEGVALRVRMGLHTGEPIKTADDYVGLDVHRTARLCAVAYGGQILLSLTTASLMAENLPPGAALRDLGLHRLKGLQQPEKIFQLQHPDLQVEFPPLQSLDVVPTNLPRQLTSFIGREREKAEVKRLLAGAPLVTLVGVGGCGKTRLALEIGPEILEDYKDGVWLVELSALSDPALATQAVASVLGVREDSLQPLLAGILDHIRIKRLLLVLDNCEHLLVACAQLADAILRNSTGVRILATSRQPLGIHGEVVWRVPSLSLPDPGRPTEEENAARCEAVQLFADRAAAVQSTFSLTPQNLKPVVEICRRLDGIPLAIELAAARVPVLSAEQIAARLDDRFRLLTQGGRTTVRRHQTLRAAMDWSYHLLSEQERTILRRLSVFAGGWTLEAAEAVCTGNGVESSDILDLLTELVFKSLVLMDEQAEGMRYRFLQTVWHYARNKLLESGEADAVRMRYMEWYVTLAERAEPALLGAEQITWLEHLEAEHDNIRTALEWALQHGDIESSLRLAGAVWRFWFVRGYLAEGRRRLEAALKESGGATAPVRAKALKAAGNLAAFGQGDYAAGHAFYEESLAIWQKLKNKEGIATLLGNLGFVAYSQGDAASGRKFYEESLALRREVGDKWGIALSLNNLGSMANRQGDYAAASALLRESLALWQELGDKQNIGRVLTNFGVAACGECDYARARAFFEEALIIRRDMKDIWGLPETLEQLAGLSVALGGHKRAARLFGAAEAMRGAIGTPLQYAHRHEYDQKVAVVRAELDENEFTVAWAEGQAMTQEEVINEALEGPPNEPASGTVSSNQAN